MAFSYCQIFIFFMSCFLEKYKNMLCLALYKFCYFDFSLTLYTSEDQASDDQDSDEEYEPSFNISIG